MDSIEITINRTGAATTIAARHLARADSRIATVCGAGVQGRIQLVAIAAARRLERIHLWDAEAEVAERLAREMSKELKLDIRPTADLSVARDSDIVVTCTSARSAFLTPDLVRPGTFIAAVGADNADKQEIDSGALCRASWSSIRWSRLPRSATCIMRWRPASSRAGDVHATLAELVAGAKPGRRDPDRHHAVRQHRTGPAGRRRRCRHLSTRARRRCRHAPFPELRNAFLQRRMPMPSA